MTAMEPKVRRPMSELMTRLRQITLPDEPNTIDSDGIVTIFTVREAARVFGVEFQFHGSVSLHIQSCEGFSVTLNETEEVVCCRILQSRLGDEQLFDTFIGDLMDLIIVCTMNRSTCEHVHWNDGWLVGGLSCTLWIENCLQNSNVDSLEN